MAAVYIFVVVVFSLCVLFVKLPMQRLVPCAFQPPLPLLPGSVCVLRRRCPGTKVRPGFAHAHDDRWPGAAVTSRGANFKSLGKLAELRNDRGHSGDFPEHLQSLPQVSAVQMGLCLLFCFLVYLIYSVFTCSDSQHQPWTLHFLLVASPLAAGRI